MSGDDGLVGSGSTWERPQRIWSARNWPWMPLCRPCTSCLSRQFLRESHHARPRTPCQGRTRTRWDRPVRRAGRERGARGDRRVGRRVERRTGFFPQRIHQLRLYWYSRTEAGRDRPRHDGFPPPAPGSGAHIPAPSTIRTACRDCARREQPRGGKFVLTLNRTVLAPYWT